MYSLFQIMNFHTFLNVEHSDSILHVSTWPSLVEIIDPCSATGGEYLQMMSIYNLKSISPISFVKIQLVKMCRFSQNCTLQIYKLRSKKKTRFFSDWYLVNIYKHEKKYP